MQTLGEPTRGEQSGGRKFPPPRYYVTAGILSAFAVGYQNWPHANGADFSIIVVTAALFGGAFWGWLAWWAMGKP